MATANVRGLLRCCTDQKPGRIWTGPFLLKHREKALKGNEPDRDCHEGRYRGYSNNCLRRDRSTIGYPSIDVLYSYSLVHDRFRRQRALASVDQGAFSASLRQVLAADTAAKARGNTERHIARQ
jgi:hypothetical protein